MAKNREMRGYDISDATLAIVKSEIDEYYSNLEKSEKPFNENEEDYYDVPTIDYTKEIISPTNNIRDITMTNALKISEKRFRFEEAKGEAKRKTTAIERGIEKAANTCYRLGEAENINLELFRNLVDKVPRKDLNIDSKTLTKYRRRAYYYIAEELGLLY